jgi:hypothetical protein
MEDVIRGDLIPANATTAIRNAQDLARFEAAHYLYIEPGLQSYFHSGRHHLIDFFPSWSLVSGLANNVYAFLHFAVPIAVLIWIYACHRPRFALVRNVMFVANSLALLGYIVYPCAPPWLTPGVTYHGRPYHFVTTMAHKVIGMKFNGHPLGYNPYAAMPSIHITWALVVAVSVVLLARRLPVRVLGALYPLVILFAIVVTANHWVMDAVGAAIDLGVAALLVLSLGWVYSTLRHRRVKAEQPLQVST